MLLLLHETRNTWRRRSNPWTWDYRKASAEGWWDRSIESGDLLLDEQVRSANGSVRTNDRLLRLDIQNGRHTSLELIEGNGCIVLSAHIPAEVFQYGIESLDYTVNGDADQVLVLTGRIAQLVRQTGEGLVEYLRIELVQRRSLCSRKRQ